jgi:hypothetical protein
METHTQRVARLFLQTIHILKNESGGQRWNAICEDAVDLAFFLWARYFPVAPFSKESLWQLLFHPPTYVQESPILLFFVSQESSPEFIFSLMQALTDPPASWWQAITA